MIIFVSRFQFYSSSTATAVPLLPQEKAIQKNTFICFYSKKYFFDRLKAEPKPAPLSAFVFYTDVLFIYTFVYYLLFFGLFLLPEPFSAHLPPSMAIPTAHAALTA